MDEFTKKMYLELENRIEDKYKGSDFEIPPKCCIEMQEQFLEHVENTSLKTKFPVLEKYQNPMHTMQGGFISAAFDNTIGPFSVLVAKKPAVSLELNTSFISPVTTKDKELIVEIFLISKSRSYLLMNGNAHNLKGKLIATCTTRLKIID
ncbi:MAG: PaaI family thioesterase [Spirochaetota bacterium]|nr:PaaI family thioesterase [Spirochaetota bacterium]